VAEDERAEAIAGLRSVISDIEQKRLAATRVQTAYLLGALHALESQQPDDLASE
jgi:hypothetical protein